MIDKGIIKHYTVIFDIARQYIKMKQTGVMINDSGFKPDFHFGVGTLVNGLIQCLAEGFLIFLVNKINEFEFLKAI